MFQKWIHSNNFRCTTRHVFARWTEGTCVLPLVTYVFRAFFFFLSFIILLVTNILSAPNEKNKQTEGNTKLFITIIHLNRQRMTTSFCRTRNATNKFIRAFLFLTNYMRMRCAACKLSKTKYKTNNKKKKNVELHLIECHTWINTNEIFAMYGPIKTWWFVCPYLGERLPVILRIVCVIGI